MRATKERGNLVTKRDCFVLSACNDEVSLVFEYSIFMERGGAVYIMTNARNTVLYTGMTNDLIRRVLEHKNGLNPKSFSSKYNLNKLVYYGAFHSIEEAIAREKQIKSGNRKRKVELVNSFNIEWKDLTEEIKKW